MIFDVSQNIKREGDDNNDNDVIWRSAEKEFVKFAKDASKKGFSEIKFSKDKNSIIF